MKNKPFSIQYVRVKLYNYIHHFGFSAKVLQYIIKFNYIFISFHIHKYTMASLESFTTLAYQFWNQKLKTSKKVEYHVVG